MKPFTTIAIVIFTLVCLTHLLRLLFGWQVTINSIVIPMWTSMIGVFIAGLLACMLWREMK